MVDWSKKIFIIVAVFFVVLFFNSNVSDAATCSKVTVTGISGGEYYQCDGVQITPFASDFWDQYIASWTYPSGGRSNRAHWDLASLSGSVMPTASHTPQYSCIPPSSSYVTIAGTYSTPTLFSSYSVSGDTATWTTRPCSTCSSSSNSFAISTCACVPSTWTPATSAYCSGVGFTQTSNCSTTRAATGTSTTGSCCIDSTWSPATSTVCNGTSFTQTSNCSRTRLATGTLTTGACCIDTTWSPATSTVCNGTPFTQTSNCSRTRAATGILTTGACCIDTTWSPATSTICNGVSFTQTSNCGRTQVAIGIYPGGIYSPDVSTVCSNSPFSPFVQTNSCASQPAMGTKLSTVWFPSQNTVCSGQSFTQTGDCGDTRLSSGTMICASGNDTENYKEVAP